MTATEARIPGRAPLREGDEFTVTGQGRFVFHGITETDRGCWITAFGGKDGREAWRYFSCDRVARVHRTKVRR